MKHKMGSVNLTSFLFDKQRPITSHGEDLCVTDYVWDQVKGQRGFKSYNYEIKAKK